MVGEGRFFDNLSEGNIVVPGDIKGDTLIATNGNGPYMRLDFDSVPSRNAKATPFAAPTGTGGDENIMIFPEGTLEWHVLGTQTILAPPLVATGLDIGMDQAANDGIEVCPGILACNKATFTVGTTAAFYAKMKFSIAVVTGADECAFGFRKAEAYQATLDGYDAMAVLNSISGDINTETITDGAVNVTIDTTDNWADGATHEFEVRVSAAGVVTYKIDGAPPTVETAFTFTDAEVVVPFMYYLHDTGLAGAIVLQHFECGLQ